MADNKSTILIVDDQLSAREVLRGLLSKYNYTLAYAVNGQEALAKAAELKPDLILLDVMMPDMNGFEVCQHLRADPHLAEVPIVMLTALDDLSARIRGIEAGADDFLNKPVNPTELLARVRTTTRLNRYRRLLVERTKFAWVIEQANDGYLLLDDWDHILYANAQARLYLDLPTNDDELISTAFLAHVQDRYQYKPEAAWEAWPEQPLFGSESVRYLVRPESPTANTFWLQVDTLKLPTTDADGGWLIRLQDVTPQINLQHRMWEFQALVSHKLRTPLLGMILGLDLLGGEDLSKPLGADMVEVFEMTLKNAHRLSGDIENVLAYLATPTMIEVDSTFPLRQLHSLIDQVCLHLNLRSVTISSELDLTKLGIPLNRSGAEVILWETLENAKKFHPQQKPVIEVSITRSTAEQQVCIRLSDDGLTLPPDQLGQVWMPYYQGEKAFTGEVVGFGLGLAKVAALIWRVGGSCRLYNRSNGPGVVVELNLPVRELPDVI